MASIQKHLIGGVGFVGDQGVFNHFMELPIPDNRILAEYIWIGGTGLDLRCKTRTMSKLPTKPEELPVWNYDGSSTGQAPGHDSEVFITPRAIFKDPFRRGNHILVMCDTSQPDGTPLPTNTRAPAQKIFEKVGDDARPMFAFEQEYSIFDGQGHHLGWPTHGFPAPQGPYYCSVGHQNAIGREIADSHYRACLYAGVYVSGINAEVMAGQWEYQVGPVIGLAAGDHLWISRYIMHRIAEKFGVLVDFDPKPIAGDWNGAGCHTNFCFKSFHEDGGKGWEAILAALEKLGKKHPEHIRVYGEGNERRLTGRHETASIHKFSWGVADRGASIRVPRQTEASKKGYIEDRRPASNMDPYTVSAKIAETVCL
jgi:glutamine synthetase